MSSLGQKANRYILIFGVMTLVPLVFLAYSLSLVWGNSCGASPPSSDSIGAERIAIIGAGAGGSSCAYYLQKFTSFGYNITVFERSNYVGGRSTTVRAKNSSTLVELGASIFIGDNEIMMNAVETFGLDHHDFSTSDEFLIWNGEEALYTYQDSSIPYYSQTKLLLRYGLSYFSAKTLVSGIVDKFLTYYYSDYFPFPSLTKLSLTTGFSELTGETSETFFTSNNIGSLYLHEIIEAVTRVNYAQNVNQIHALGASVCMAAGSAYSVTGGNWQVFDSFIKVSEANLLLQHGVASIKKNAQSNFEVTAVDSSGYEFTEEYDQVVIAAPYYQTNINLPTGYSSEVENRQYVELHVTLLTTFGTLSKSYFNADYVPTTVITSSEGAQKNTPFFSISKVGNISETTESIYKIFSPAELSDKFITTLFEKGSTISWVHRKTWKPYPYLKPTTQFTDFQLDQDGLWYLNGMEEFISTMETSALAGANVAALISKGKNTTFLTVP
ncbi:unnamed protein product [Kuraishia capsulata CBS 1993]|uniref:Prenylcysteine lyase domain-containing protein n=1 Tax=Kuraishia capsulata CBS 1993 TaxID=1382522 RepID=W6MKM8_9ASCO|nr:uncharacterized protein KUCA_T00002530001 [Kuraishia capsulata CBS 1993]CDK26558.1 unnamed protein product [Kuraishia capsulata CBS 1993]